jgi:HK97 family phage major capsid protein
VFKDLPSGRILRTLRADEPMNQIGFRPDYGIGDLVRAATTGDWSRLPSPIHRAGSAGIGPAGGLLVPPELAGWIVDLARAEAQVLRAGAITVEMPAGNLSIGTVVSDPMPQWKSENAWIAVSGGAYGRIEMTARMLSAIVPISIELATSAANINDLLNKQLVEQMGLRLDTAAIFGDGTQNTPKGIINIAGVGNVSVGAMPTNYSAFNTGIGLCLAANARLQNLSVLMNSDVSTLLSGLTDTLGQPLRAPPNYQKIRDRGAEYLANSILSAGTPKSTFALIGDFTNVIIGMQQNITLEVSREGGYQNPDASVGSAFGQGQILVRAYMMVDVAVQRPAFFTQVSNIHLS